MTSSLSIKNCQYDPNSYGEHLFGAGIGPCQPKPSGGTLSGCDITFLNPQLVKMNTARNFCSVDGKYNPCMGYRREAQWMPKPEKDGWTAADARLKNPRTGNISLILDSKPIDFSVGPENVYNPNLNAWKTGFQNYQDIAKGQYTYYTDKNTSGPFISPVFQNEAVVFGSADVTPMNTIEPEYARIPVKCRNCLETNLCRCAYLGGLSWIEDSNEQREDIISKQMSVMNREKWAARWGNHAQPLEKRPGADEVHRCKDGKTFTCPGGTRGCYDESPMYC